MLIGVLGFRERGTALRLLRLERGASERGRERRAAAGHTLGKGPRSAGSCGANA